MARVCQPRACIQQHQHEEKEARVCMRAGNHKFPGNGNARSGSEGPVPPPRPLVRRERLEAAVGIPACEAQPSPTAAFRKRNI